jgi:hypothetical protein
MTQKYWNLDLTYKGDRNYLHGTDIIFELFETIGVVESAVFQFHKVAVHQLKACYIDESDLTLFRAMSETCAIVFFVTPSKEKKIIVLIEDEERRVSNRTQYNELEAVECCTIVNNIATQQNNNCFTFFEQVVALNKKLLNEIFGKKEWLFTRLDLKGHPINIDDISIDFIREVGGSMYKSNILSNNIVLGCIFFSPRAL